MSFNLPDSVCEPGTPALAAIRDSFGPEYITDEGSLDRAKLAELVFSDASARKRLNAITHPGMVDALLGVCADCSFRPLTHLRSAGGGPFRDYENHGTAVVQVLF